MYSTDTVQENITLTTRFIQNALISNIFHYEYYDFARRNIIQIIQHNKMIKFSNNKMNRTKCIFSKIIPDRKSLKTPAILQAVPIEKVFAARRCNKIKSFLGSTEEAKEEKGRNKSGGNSRANRLRLLLS